MMSPENRFTLFGIMVLDLAPDSDFGSTRSEIIRL